MLPLLPSARAIGRRLRRRGSRCQRLASATAVQVESTVRRISVVSHGGQPCQLLEWRLPDEAEAINGWLEDWRGGGTNSEAQFWRQRTVMSLQSKLRPSKDDFERRDGGGRTPVLVKNEDDGVRLYALHLEADLPAGFTLRVPAPDAESISGLIGQPVALTLTLVRRFPVGPLEALHLDQLLTRPDTAGASPLRGAGAALIGALKAFAAGDGRVITVEPQSELLEAYFSNLGFRPAPRIDPYLWFLAGTDPHGNDQTIEVRYVLPAEQDVNKLLAAFKRPPEWLATSEEVFIRSREDSLASDVVGVLISRVETFTRATAVVRRFSRQDPRHVYQVGPAEAVEVIDAMGVSRNPELIRQVSWSAAECLDVGGRSGGGTSCTVLGRCSVSQRAFPLPGFAQDGIELVVDSCELPLMLEPIYSVCVKAPLAQLSEVVEATKGLLDKFHVRAALYPSSAVWNLDVVQSDGLAAASLEFPAVPDEDEHDDRLDF